MCSLNVSRVNMTSNGDNCNASTDKSPLSSATLKRNPRMELNRNDLLRLLSILEGELQAREIVIAVLKAEQIKKLLYPNKLWPKVMNSSKTVQSNNFAADESADRNISYNDPFNALSRDLFCAYDTSFDESTTKVLFNFKMNHLESLIMQQRKARNALLEHLRHYELKYNKLVLELEEERRCKLNNQNGSSDSRMSVLESDIKSVAQTLENEKIREKQIILCLLSERKQLIIKLIEERQRNEELLQLLTTEKGKIAEMVEGLEDESKRSLQMEAELEKYLSDFECERQKFRKELAASESKNAELTAEVNKLRDELQLTKSVNIGEGVRSAIVTSSATRVVPTVPSISTVSPPRASIARPVSPKSTTNSQQIYATVQPISAKMNANIPPPPSAPAPPPKVFAANNKSPLNSNTQPNTTTANLDESKAMATHVSTNVASGAATNSTAAQPPNHSANNAVNEAVIATNKSEPQTQVMSSHQPIQRKLSSGGVNRGTPPPIPPNKPVMKPVFPPQALQQRNKEVNAKLVSSSQSTAKSVSQMSSNTATNNIKNSTLSASESARSEGENDFCNDNSEGNSDVDLLCQELENFNSLLVSMVATASNKNS